MSSRQYFLYQGIHWLIGDVEDVYWSTEAVLVIARASSSPSLPPSTQMGHLNISVPCLPGVLATQLLEWEVRLATLLALASSVRDCWKAP